LRFDSRKVFAQLIPADNALLSRRGKQNRDALSQNLSGFTYAPVHFVKPLEMLRSQVLLRNRTMFRFLRQLLVDTDTFFDSSVTSIKVTQRVRIKTGDTGA